LRTYSKIRTGKEKKKRKVQFLIYLPLEGTANEKRKTLSVIWIKKNPAQGTKEENHPHSRITTPAAEEKKKKSADSFAEVPSPYEQATRMGRSAADTRKKKKKENGRCGQPVPTTYEKKEGKSGNRSQFIIEEEKRKRKTPSHNGGHKAKKETDEGKKKTEKNPHRSPFGLVKEGGRKGIKGNRKPGFSNFINYGGKTEKERKGKKERDEVLILFSFSGF